jgi:hypothetical protein
MSYVDLTVSMSTEQCLSIYTNSIWRCTTLLISCLSGFINLKRDECLLNVTSILDTFQPVETINQQVTRLI